MKFSKKLTLIFFYCFSPILLSSYLNAKEISNTHQHLNKTEKILKTSLKNFNIIIPYDESYFTYSIFNKNVNFDKKTTQPDEIKYQFSFAIPILKEIYFKDYALALSYTQKSFFQLRNWKQSAPFRDTNYEPKLFLAISKKFNLPFGFKTEDFEIGYHHASNGRFNTPKNRSINRLYAKANFSKSFEDKGNLFLETQLWWRIPETYATKELPDFNEDIIDFISFGDITLGYEYKKHQVKAKAHYNIKSNKGGLELGYSYTINNYIRLYSQVFLGYGENLLDYNKKTYRFAAGLSLSDLF